MQINLTINLEPDELATLIKLLGAAPLAPRAAETALDASRDPELPVPTGTPVLPPVAPATQEASRAPDAESEPMTTFIGNTLAAHDLVALDEWTPVATQQPTAKPTKRAPAKRPAISPGEEEKPGRLPFDQFDKLVRSEMKRLGMDGRMPNHRLWNDERNVQLPTMAGVMLRYGCNNLIDLAEKLDVLPPLSALNGVGYRKEAA